MAAVNHTIRLRDEFLPVCGIQNTGPVNARQSTELITSQGLTSVEDFRHLSRDDEGKLVKSFNDSTPTSGRIGFIAMKGLQALAYWVTDRMRRNLSVEPADWDTDALQDAKIQGDIAEERKSNPSTPKRIPKISSGLEWYTWNEQWENYLSSIRGVGDVPLSYVIRRDKPAGWDPETDAANEEEKLIYQVPLTGPEFEADNKTVWNKLLELTQGEPAYEWIRQFE